MEWMIFCHPPMEEKHDYDWLLTPPGTPLFPSLDGSESQPSSTAPRSSSLARPVFRIKSSRLSVTIREQPEEEDGAGPFDF
ncbi:hypothetical protein U1Q18_029480 [Sarracenia purpurea var. burkii]